MCCYTASVCTCGCTASVCAYGRSACCCDYIAGIDCSAAGMARPTAAGGIKPRSAGAREPANDACMSSLLPASMGAATMKAAKVDESGPNGVTTKLKTASSSLDLGPLLDKAITGARAMATKGLVGSPPERRSKRRVDSIDEHSLKRV